MKTRPRITISQTQRLALNTGLVASIQILRTDAAGLTRYLEEQAADNPHLALEPAAPADWLPRWKGAMAQSASELTDVPGAGPSLIAHVMAQIDAMALPRQDQALALAFADALEPTGWLGRPAPAIAAACGTTVDRADAMLARLQRGDPPGLFARSLAECLELQARDAGVLDPVLAGMIAHLPLLAQGETARLAALLRVPLAEVTARLRTLRSFDPKPGARFEAFAAPVREPDLVVTAGPDGWLVALNRAALPSLRLTGAQGPGRAEARALLRMVEGRNATLLQVAREILQRQSAALDHGPTALVPMTMTDVAGALSLNQSTVSRIVAGVAVDTPRGTWWLRALFSGRVGGRNGGRNAGTNGMRNATQISGGLSGSEDEGEGGTAAAALRGRLAELVAAEDRAAPLSDAALADALAREGADVARRTVAKYRAALHIAPAHRRRLRPALPARRGAGSGVES